MAVNRNRRYALNEQEIKNFREDGAVILRGAFVEWVNDLRAGIAETMAAPSNDSCFYPEPEGGDPEGGGRYFSDYCCWQRINIFKRFIFRSNSAELAMDLMGTKTVRLFHDNVMVTEPLADIPTPWHHDLPYYPIEGKDTCSIWIALDGVPRDMAMEFIAGSHRWGKLFRPKKIDGTPFYEGEEFEPVPDIEADRSYYRILGWGMEPGDAVAFSFSTLHSVPGNRQTGNARRAYSIELTGDDVKWVRRPGVTAPPFGKVALTVGDELTGSEFPFLSRVG